MAKKNNLAPTTATEEVEPTFFRFNGEIQDAANYNASTTNFNGPGLPFHELDAIGTQIRGKTLLPLGENTPGTVNWQIDYGIIIEPHKGVITYAFNDSAHMPGIYNSPHWQQIYGFTEHLGYTPFTESQRVGARQAMQNWDDLVAVTFKEVNGPGGADITLANTFTGPAQAHAYIPYNWGDPAFEHIMGDVWVADPRVNPSNVQLNPGQYGLQTLNHEIGHSLGLSHPGNYDFGNDSDGDGEPDPITYEGDAFYFQDSHQYTIMSYFDAYETGSDTIDWNLMRYVYPSTPMVHDVAIIQAKYGADMTTRTGDTTYGFNATADVKNAAMRFEPNEMLTVFTIWDAGGNDTLDLSGYNSNSIIDLREGGYSSAGGPGRQLSLAEVNANNAAAGLGSRTAAYDLYIGGRPGANEGIAWADIVKTDFVMDNNIGIAYGAVIENAIGGGGNDRINGNQANNRLTGNGGADTFVLLDDSSTDTITDFKSGVDRIDLSALGVDASDIRFDGKHLYVQTDENLVHIVSQGDAIVMSDLFFG
jgi:hypothetical protein